MQHKCSYAQALMNPKCKEDYETSKQAIKDLEERFRRLAEPSIIDVVTPPPSPPPPPPSPPPRPPSPPPPPVVPAPAPRPIVASPPPTQPARYLYRPTPPPQFNPTRRHTYKMIWCTRMNQPNGCKFGIQCDFAHSRFELEQSLRELEFNISKSQKKLESLLKMKRRVLDTLQM